MKVRGYLTVGAVGLFLLLADLFQRTAVAAAVKIAPSKKHVILGRWQRWIAHFVLGLVHRIGGASFGELPRIPAGPGILLLMNHQSLLDIPLLVASMDDLYPRIVTRARYAHGKPLISHMVRLYQYPVVEPRATIRHHLDSIEAAARESSVPMAIYPEGTRTRNGDIGPWKRTGLERILQARRWEVYVVVGDGFWQAARLDDFVASIPTVHGRVGFVGPFRSPAPGEPMDPFMDDMRRRMQELLDELRLARPAVS